MRTLVQDLLALSRSGRAAMKLDEVHLLDCVDRALSNLSETIETSNAQITRTELPTLRVDPTLITQLYQNLIGNAVRYAHPERRPVVEITAERVNGAWVLGVKDNGIGIKKEYVAQVFAPFKRLHGRSEYEGTGIVLAICHKVVARHDGRIWVESEPSHGSHFRFTIGTQEETSECTGETLELQSSS